MNKCKFAHDQSDEYCKNCNGLEFEVDGEKIQSIECGGFEPCDEIAPWEEPIKTDEKLGTAQTVKNADLSDGKEININTLPTAETPLKPQISTSNGCISNATVKSINYSSSVTVKIDDNYYKFTASEEWEMNNNCDVEKERQALWTKINEEVDNQVKGVLK